MATITPLTTAEQARHAIALLVAAYAGDTRLLRDVAHTLEASLADVDRATVEAHLDRSLTDTERAALGRHFTGLDFDDHVGDAGTLRTRWIDSLLERAGLPTRSVGRTP